MIQLLSKFFQLIIFSIAINLVKSYPKFISSLKLKTIFTPEEYLFCVATQCCNKSSIAQVFRECEDEIPFQQLIMKRYCQSYFDWKLLYRYEADQNIIRIVVINHQIDYSKQNFIFSKAKKRSFIILQMQKEIKYVIEKSTFLERLKFLMDSNPTATLVFSGINSNSQLAYLLALELKEIIPNQPIGIHQFYEDGHYFSNSITFQQINYLLFDTRFVEQKDFDSQNQKEIILPDRIIQVDSQDLLFCNYANPNSEQIPVSFSCKQRKFITLDSIEHDDKKPFIFLFSDCQRMEIE